MTAVVSRYATDEDLALRAPADFALICPAHQCLAKGLDGVFESTDRWLMRSASVSFDLQGVRPGHIVQLTKAADSLPCQAELFAIESVGPNSIRLRRTGQVQSTGQPPVSSGGQNNVCFLITSLDPQLERASFELNRRFGIDDLIAGRRTSDLYDPREVRDVVVLSVLHQQYLAMSRAITGELDAFATKALVVKSELDDLLARVVVHWHDTRYSSPSSNTSRFDTRLSR